MRAAGGAAAEAEGATLAVIAKGVLKRVALLGLGAGRAGDGRVREAAAVWPVQQERGA